MVHEGKIHDRKAGKITSIASFFREKNRYSKKNKDNLPDMLLNQGWSQKLNFQVFPGAGM